MKTLKQIFFGLACLASSTVMAIPMSDVGGIDTLLASGAISPSNPAKEEAWVEGVLGFDVVFSAKNDGSFSWEQVDGMSNVFAQALTEASDYFLVKTGKGHPDGFTHFLYQNSSLLNYAVVDLLSLGFGTISITKISHISQFDAPNSPFIVDIAEPGSMLLIGLALLAAARRRV